MVEVDVRRGGRVTGFEHGGDPGVANAAVKGATDIVDHPVDGLAGLGAPEVKALRRAVHLVLGETEGGEHFVTEVGIVGTTFFD